MSGEFLKWYKIGKEIIYDERKESVMGVWRKQDMKKSTHIGSVDIQIDTDRLDRNVREVQKLLNMQIVADCDPLIPFRQGALRNSVQYPEGVYGGEVAWNTPYAHYQYIGEIYGPNIPVYDGAGNLTGYFSPPKKKPTGRPLQYHTGGTTDHWFDRAKEKHGAEWIRLVRETIGKG